MLSIPHGSSESWSLLCGPWSSFVVSFPLGPYSRFLVPCWPPSSGSQWPVLRFPMAHPLVSNGPSTGSQWPTFWFSMAHLLVPNGPPSGSQWPILRLSMARPLWSLPWLYLSSSLQSPLWFQALPQDCFLFYLQPLLPNLPLYFYFHFYLHLPFKW